MSPFARNFPVVSAPLVEETVLSPLGLGTLSKSICHQSMQFLPDSHFYFTDPYVCSYASLTLLGLL